MKPKQNGVWTAPGRLVPCPHPPVKPIGQGKVAIGRPSVPPVGHKKKINSHKKCGGWRTSQAEIVTTTKKKVSPKSEKPRPPSNQRHLLITIGQWRGRGKKGLRHRVTHNRGRREREKIPRLYWIVRRYWIRRRVALHATGEGNSNNPMDTVLECIGDNRTTEKGRKKSDRQTERGSIGAQIVLFFPHPKEGAHTRDFLRNLKEFPFFF